MKHTIDVEKHDACVSSNTKCSITHHVENYMPHVEFFTGCMILHCVEINTVTVCVYKQTPEIIWEWKKIIHNL